MRHSLQIACETTLPADAQSVANGKVDLSAFQNTWYHPGRGKLVRMAWYLVNHLVFASAWCPSYELKRRLLRLFGAKIGKGVVIKPGVNIKYPWNLQVGDHTWIGEGVHIDSLAKITIGSNCCLSQHVYLCTGSHDWTDPAFGLIIKPIELEDGVWCGCRSVLTPGVRMASHSVLAAGSTLTKDAATYTVYQGNAATPVKQRRVGSAPGDVSDAKPAAQAPQAMVG